MNRKLHYVIRKLEKSRAELAAAKFELEKVTARLLDAEDKIRAESLQSYEETSPVNAWVN